jgi:hypothetical protein
MHNRKGLRWIIIAGMTREQKIELIKRRDAEFVDVDFKGFSDATIHRLANIADRKAQAVRFKKVWCN